MLIKGRTFAHALCYKKNIEEITCIVTRIFQKHHDNWKQKNNLKQKTT